MHRIWKVVEHDVELSKRLASELEIPLLIAQLLVNRGIVDARAAREFLYPDLANLHPPSKMKGISNAVDRIKEAISRGEKIWIYGDYDVDGITSISLLMSCLKRLGADVDYYIPHRLDEGYGLKPEGVSDLKGRGCSLIITVDCGIGAAEEVQMANDAGMDVIITDHHEPRDEIPKALVTLDPKLEGSGYPFDGLAGVGVAFKLAQALMGDKEDENQDFLQEQLDLVALGTIADVVPLTGENRIIAKYGLDVMNKMKRAGIRALCEVSDIAENSIASWTVSFRLGPRINAAGRVDTAHSAVQLLTTDSYQEAFEIAQKLDAANRERQNIERQILEAARHQLQRFDMAGEKALILAEEKWHPGVIGIVASRLQEQFYRPVILISLEGNQGRGSARSIPELDIFHALTKCSHLLEEFGGHKAAAGLSIAKENIGKFRNEFSRIISDTLSPEDLKPKVLIDAKVSIPQLSQEAVEKLSLLEPHGLGNPRPLLMLEGVALRGLPRIVGNGKHLQMTVSDGRAFLRTIAFNMANLERELYDKDVRLDLTFRPSVDVWNDTKSVQLKIEEVIVHRPESQDLMAASAEIMDVSQFKIADRRNYPDKRRYIQKLLLLGERTLFYVRDDVAADQLQKIVLKYSPKTRLGLCYSAANDIDNIKLMLIDDKLDAVVSCIPFEEPLPGLKHLVFCHPMPTRDDFVRCCAPAIETEELIYLHLIFNNSDIELLTATLNHQYPDRSMLANVYRKARELSTDKNNEPVLIEELAEGMSVDGPKELIVSSCMIVFEEIGLAERREINGKMAILLPPGQQERRDLQDSKRYSYGEKIKSEWAKFSEFMMKKTSEDIRRILLETI